MRRLQSIQYFGDLEDVLQTTYEQHVIGTSELMKNFPKSILKVRVNFYTKFLLAALNDRVERSKDQHPIYSAMKTFYDGYSRRLSEISSIPSLLGMLATPPMRRPLGTTLKRSLMRVMNRLLYEGESNIINKLKIMKENIINFYHYLLLSTKVRSDGEQGSKRQRCLHEFIEPINTLVQIAQEVFEKDLNLPIRDFKDLVLEAYCEEYLEMINKLYTRRLYPYDNIKEEKDNLYLEYYLPTTFLLRFRTLGTALGAGYAIKIILNKLYNNIKQIKERPSNKDQFIEDLKDVILEAHDSMLQLGEAILINNSTTLVYSKELARIQIKCKKCGNTIELLLPVLIGVPNIIFNEGGVLLENEKGLAVSPCEVSDREKIINFNDNSNNYEVIIKYRNREIKPPATSISILEKPEEIRDIEYADHMVPCCVLKPRGKTRGPSMKYEKWYKSIINNLYNNYRSVTQSVATHLMLELLTDNGIEKLANLMKNNYNIGEEQYLSIASIVPMREMNPYISHFKINLIQSDMMPSAYQLDLLHRLDKDINIGIRVDYENLDEVVLGIDIYSFLTFTTLSSIYMYLFSDTTTLSRRIEILYKINDSKIDLKLEKNIFKKKGGINISLRGLDLYLILYFSTLAISMKKNKNEIEKIIKEIEKITDFNCQEQHQTPTSAVSNKEEKETITRLCAILNAAKTYKIYLEHYAALLDTLVIKYLEDILNERNDISNVNPEDIIKHVLKEYLNCDEKCSSGKSDYEPFLTLIDKFIKNKIINKTLDDGGLRILIHAKAPLSEILIRSNFLRKLATQYYNGLSYTTLHTLQNVYGPELDNALKQILNRRLDNILYSLPELETIIVQVPVQGILKFYFHLPERATLMPRVVEALNPRLFSFENNAPSELENIRNRYENLADSMINFTRQISSDQDFIKLINEGKLNINNMPSINGTGIIILPDLRLWNTLGPTDRINEFTPFDPKNIRAATRFLFRTVNIIIASVIKIKSGETKTPLSTRTILTIQNELMNTVSEFISYMFGSPYAI